MQADILVPLDGSRFSETIVPHAAMLAKATRRPLVLLQAVAPPALADVVPAMPVPETAIYEAWQAEVEGARAYLEQVAEQLRSQGLEVRVIAEMGLAPEAILKHGCETCDVSLIAMATHGRTGLLRLLLGSVAEEVVREARKPVLLQRPKEEDDLALAARIEPYRTILVPLDGSPLAEHAIAPAKEIAATLGANLVLATVLPSLDETAFVAEKTALDWHRQVQREATEQTGVYLSGLAEKLTAEGLQTRTEVVFGYASEAILRVAEDVGADLIAMATHGHTGLQRVWLGSTAMEVVHHSQPPVLLVRPPEVLAAEVAG